MTAEHAHELDAQGDEAKLIAAVEQATRGRVTGLHRHQRWRPSWTADVERGGETFHVYVRGDRVGLETKPLRQEYEVILGLQRQGIPVPKILGWCDSPAAILMEHLDGEPYEGGADVDPVKRAAVEHYMTILARIHALDPSDFAIPGLPLPQDRRSAALGYFEVADRAYQAAKQAPEPLIEFVRGWVLRNVPETPAKLSLLIGDAPQFMMKDGRLLALIDLEMAGFGDAMADLASMRLRDTIEPTGNLAELYRQYRDARGVPLDRELLAFHTIVNFICVPMLSGSSLRTVRPHPAFLEYYSWGVSGGRCALECIAGTMGLTLAPPPAIEPSCDGRIDAFDDLVAHTELLELPPGFFRQHPLLSLAHFTRRSQLLGPGIDKAQLDDMARILGHRPDDIVSGKRELEAFVLAAGPEQDEMLLRYFHREAVRGFALMQDYPTPINQRWLTDISEAFD